MNILTDVLSLIRRGVFAKKAELDDVLVIGKWNETPDMTGVASPIPYKSVKVIRVRDFKVAAEHCDHTNSPAIPLAGTGQVYQKTDVDEDTETCTVYFRSLKSMSSNLTLSNSADDDYVEITTEGEPNLAANVGSGSQVWKDKVGETLNFRSLVQGSNITIAQSPNEITINALVKTYTYTATTSGSNVDLNIVGSDGSTDTVKLVGGNNIDLTVTGPDIVTIDGTGSGGGMTSFLVGGDSGSNQTVSDGDTVDIEGGDGISTVGTGGPKVVVNMDHYYQAYVCKLDQTGTNNPTESIVYNDTGLTITWTRVGTGSFRATWSTPVNGAKVTVNPMATFKNAPNIINVIAFTNASFTINTYNLSGASTLVDSVFQDTPIEIRIYP